MILLCFTLLVCKKAYTHKHTHTNSHSNTLTMEKKCVVLVEVLVVQLYLQRGCKCKIDWIYVHAHIKSNIFNVKWRKVGGKHIIIILFFLFTRKRDKMRKSNEKLKLKRKEEMMSCGWERNSRIRRKNKNMVPYYK